MDRSRTLKTLAALALILAMGSFPAAAGGNGPEQENLSPLQRLAMESAGKAQKEQETSPVDLPEGIRSLTDTKWQEFSPTWAPDSKTLYYTLIGKGMGLVARLAPGQAEPDTIAAAQYWNCDHPAISPDGNHLAYRSRKSGQLAIWIHRLEDGAEGKLTPENEPIESWPTWSASGMSLFYERHIPTSTSSKAVSCQRTGEGMKILSDDRGNHSFPRVSPDGKQVAWLHRWNQLTKIVIVDTEIAVFTKNVLIQGYRITSMDWLPDGRHFIVSYKDESLPGMNFDLGLLNIADGSIVSLVDLGPFDSEPRVSPDGTHVVFSSNLRGQYDLFLWELPDSLQGRE